jgi:hypothetical protein
LSATRQFTFDLTGALAQQLESELPGLVPESLSPGSLLDVSATPGIYQLYLDGEIVYVGKADKNLRARLTDHYRKISGRLNIAIDDVSFTGLYLEGTWIPVGPEQMLINRLQEQGTKPLWNFNGFGINDPGKERDSTNFRPEHFDMIYPANLSYRIDNLEPGEYLVGDLLRIVKQSLPYVFRHENKYANHPDYLTSLATISGDPPEALEVFESLMEALPAGWQATALPGYVIMYKNRRSYPSARRVFLSK